MNVELDTLDLSVGYVKQIQESLSGINPQLECEIYAEWNKKPLMRHEKFDYLGCSFDDKNVSFIFYN